MNLSRLKKPNPILLAAIVCSLPFGCGTVKVVTIPTTQPRQLAETLQAYVYIETKDGQRIKSKNRTPLYEGEWVLTDPGN